MIDSFPFYTIFNAHKIEFQAAEEDFHSERDLNVFKCS